MNRNLVVLTLLGLLSIVSAQNRIDTVRPDAPELAAFGAFRIGVRTLELTNPDQLDIVNAQPGEDMPRYDRPLVLEVWYPAEDTENDSEGDRYEVVTRDGSTPATLHGRAGRDATPLTGEGPFPLVILSHGYPGNRFLLSHFGENLASKGYVVASIDHTDSTYSDQDAFGSTLLNRPLDQLFVLDEMARLNDDTESFLAGLVNAERSAIIGYSMGGYGALNAVGGGFTAESAEFGFAPPDGLLRLRQAGQPEFTESLDERVRSVIAIGPWGMNAGFWDAEGLAGIDTPVFFMAGSIDDVSGYEQGVKAIFEQTVNAERYLLTFENANHNAAAPIPAPREVMDDAAAFSHYAEPVWDMVRMNNIAQHFATAFLGVHLQGDEHLAAYLDLIEDAEAGVVDLDEEGQPTDEHSYWRGFPERTAVGLRLEAEQPE